MERVEYDPHTNMYIWTKGIDAHLSAHFSTGEFECHCDNASCISQHVDKALIEKLEAARKLLDMPIQVTSGYRCAAHQAALRRQGFETAAGVSQHELGRAADIRALDMHALRGVVDGLFLAIGTARSFLHVDLRDGRPRRWTYSS